MKRNRLHLVSVLAAASIGGYALAAPRFVTSQVVNIDPTARTITIQPAGDPIELVLKVDAETAIQIGAKKGRLDAIEKGQRVSVGYETLTRRATRIRVMDGAAPTSSKKSRKPADDIPAPDEASRPATPAPRSVRRAATGGGTSDWPQWRGPNQDGISPETGLLESWPAQGPTELWNAPMGEGFSSVAIAGGRAYTMYMRGGLEHVAAFDAETGRQAWIHSYNGAYQNSFGNGSRSTPTIDGNRVYAYGATGWLHCLDTDNGKVVWQRNLLEDFNAENIQWGQSASPLVHQELVFVNPGGRNGNSVAALDKDTGRTVWKHSNDHAGYATPLAANVVGTDAVIFFTAAGLLGVEPRRGEELFRFLWTTQHECNIATPIYAEGHIFISSGYGTGCALLEASRRGSRINLRQVYKNNEMKNHFSTCVLLDGNLYGFDDAILACLDFRTGQTRWSQRGFGKGSLIAADGKLIVLGDNGRLALVQPMASRYQEISSFDALGGKCWSAPALAAGKLFVRNQETLRVFAVR